MKPNRVVNSVQSRASDADSTSFIAAIPCGVGATAKDEKEEGEMRPQEVPLEQESATSRLLEPRGTVPMKAPTASSAMTRKTYPVESPESGMRARVTEADEVSSRGPTLPGGAPSPELAEPWDDEPEPPDLPPAPPRRAMSDAEAREVLLIVVCIGMVGAVLFLVVVLTIFTALWEPSARSVAPTLREGPLVLVASSRPPAPTPSAAPAVTSSAAVPTTSVSATEAPRPPLPAVAKAPAPPMKQPRRRALVPPNDLVDPWGTRR